MKNPPPLGTVNILILRNAGLFSNNTRYVEIIEVSVDILSHHKGTSDFDDPESVEVCPFGVTTDGKTIALTAAEMDEAASKFLTEREKL
jgi:hypothetical protein